MYLYLSQCIYLEFFSTNSKCNRILTTHIRRRSRTSRSWFGRKLTWRSFADDTRSCSRPRRGVKNFQTRCPFPFYDEFGYKFSDHLQRPHRVIVSGVRPLKFVVLHRSHLVERVSRHLKTGCADAEMEFMRVRDSRRALSINTGVTL